MTEASELRLELGARLVDSSTEFRVWAPNARSVEVLLVGPPERRVPLGHEPGGYFAARVEQVGAGADYFFVLDAGEPRPDPVSRCQPHGVHGPSRVVDPRRHVWRDEAWRGHSLSEYVIYELHVGTFTTEGTFDAIIPRLRELVELGVTAVELMPVGQFPGERNWGYDGAYLFAPQWSYGGPDGLKRLVDACHAHGLAVVLDVVYNHLGPEGNYLGVYGPYFTDRYRTPWGSALNFDGPESDAVRRLVLDNARFWLTEYHVDALRLDAIHGIFDFSARHLLAELADVVAVEAEHASRPLLLIAESDLNDVRVIAPREQGGHGLDGQWSDDFHHSLFTVLGGGEHGYFADFGRVADLAKALDEGFVYDGRYSAFRRRRHGSSSAGRPGCQLVTYIQNHDQVANASSGARLATRLDPARERLAACVLLTAPNTPLLFMGQEYGETNPFHYFVDHGDAALLEAVRRGRRAEMEELGFGAAYADPASAETFRLCVLDWSKRQHQPHAGLLALYRTLIALRRSKPALGSDRRDLQRVRFDEAERWLTLERWSPASDRALLVANFDGRAKRVPVEAIAGTWSLAVATDSVELGGAGAEPVRELRLGTGEPVAVELTAWSAALYLIG